MEYDGEQDQNNLPSGTESSPTHSHSPQADPSRKLRKQWFQENDLDYYYGRPEAKMQEFCNQSKSDSRPCWLVDDVQTEMEPNVSDIRNMSKQNPRPRKEVESSNSRDHSLANHAATGSKGNFKSPDVPNQDIHRFLSNPGLKFPYANDYKQEGTYMSENSSAYRARGSISTQDMICNHTNNPNRCYLKTRLKSHRSQPSEMFKLLSYGYCEGQNEANDTAADNGQGKTNHLVKHNEPYKPTWEQPAPFGKKKMSFSEGRPDFFNIDKLEKDSRANFRRKKVDINSLLCQGPTKL